MRHLVVMLVAGATVAFPAVAAGAAPPAVTAVEAVGERTAIVRADARGARGRTHLSVRAGRSGWRTVPVSGRARLTVRLTALRPATLHRVRLVVTTARRTVHGPTRSFTTRAVAAVSARAPAAEPTLPTPAPPPPPPEPIRSAPAMPADASPPPVRDAVADFPDPMVLRDGGHWYAYATGEGFQVARSDDLVRWTAVGRALTQRPSWALAEGEAHPWAPSVLPTDAPCPGTASPRCFLLFHTSLSGRVSPTTNCVGVAASPTPEGPFAELGLLEHQDGTAVGEREIGCGDARGYGNIDAAPFVDEDGRAWLYVSTDWACETGGCILRPTLSVIPLAPDLVHAAGQRQELFAGRPQTWEQAPWAPVVENPWVVRRGATYHLLFSGGSWMGAYGMGHATSSSPTGPFVRSSSEPWLSGTDAIAGPGGGMLVAGADDGDGDLLAYHGRDPGSAGRALRLGRVAWDVEGRPRLAGPAR